MSIKIKVHDVCRTDWLRSLDRTCLCTV